MGRHGRGVSLVPISEAFDVFGHKALSFGTSLCVKLSKEVRVSVDQPDQVVTRPVVKRCAGLPPCTRLLADPEQMGHLNLRQTGSPANRGDLTRREQSTPAVLFVAKRAFEFKGQNAFPARAALLPRGVGDGHRAARYVWGRIEKELAPSLLETRTAANRTFRRHGSSPICKTARSINEGERTRSARVPVRWRNPGSRPSRSTRYRRSSAPSRRPACPRDRPHIASR